MQEHPSPPLWLYLVPNLLSGLRLGLAFAFPFISPRHWVVIIIVAGVSDLADGFIARKFGLATWIGGLLDAAADKGFVISVLITLAITDRLEWWHVAIVLPRDVSVGLIAAYAAALRRWDGFRRMQSRVFGKLTTFFVFAVLVVAVALPDQTLALYVLLTLAAVSSTLAAMDYLVQFVRALAADRSPDIPEGSG